MYRSYDAALTPHNFLCDVCSLEANGLVELKRGQLKFVCIAGRKVPVTTNSQ
jgi:hypothetical protein